MKPNILQQYYNEVFKPECDTDFTDFTELTNDQIRAIRSSFGFALYRLRIAGEQFVKAARAV